MNEANIHFLDYWRSRLSWASKQRNRLRRTTHQRFDRALTPAVTTKINVTSATSTRAPKAEKILPATKSSDIEETKPGPIKNVPDTRLSKLKDSELVSVSFETPNGNEHFHVLEADLEIFNKYNYLLRTSSQLPRELTPKPLFNFDPGFLIAQLNKVFFFKKSKLSSDDSGVVDRVDYKFQIITLMLVTLIFSLGYFFSGIAFLLYLVFLTWVNN